MYELAEHILSPNLGKSSMPNPKFGEPSTWTDLEAFRNAVMDGTLHPLDAKFGVADGLAKGLESLANHFDANPETLDRVTALMNR